MLARKLSPERGWTRSGVPTRTLGPERGGLEEEVPHQLEKGTSESERGRWLEEGWIARSHIGWGGNETFFTKVWKPLPSKRVLKKP